MSNEAQVGDLVEVINDKPSSAQHAQPPFKNGMIFKVTALTVTPGSGKPAYVLEGVEAAWSRSRFKKIDPDGLKQSWKETLTKHKPVKVPDLVDA